MKIRTLVCSVKFHSPEVALCLYNSVPIKGSQFMNCESFLDFHESFFDNILKIAVFLAIKSKLLSQILIYKESHLIVPPTNFLKTELPYHKDSIIVKNTY